MRRKDTRYCSRYGRPERHTRGPLWRVSSVAKENSIRGTQREPTQVLARLYVVLSIVMAEGLFFFGPRLLVTYVTAGLACVLGILCLYHIEEE